jgi:hypothetical protein
MPAGKTVKSVCTTPYLVNKALQHTRRLRVQQILIGGLELVTKLKAFFKRPINSNARPHHLISATSQKISFFDMKGCKKAERIVKQYD